MVNALDNSKSLPDIIREVHRFTALWIKKNINIESINQVDGYKRELTRLIQKGEQSLVVARSGQSKRPKKGKIFYNYRDTCITYEKSYYARLNYIWYNPVKHGYVDSPEKWKFGSYYSRFWKDVEEMQRLMKKYPFDKVKVKDDF